MIENHLQVGWHNRRSDQPDAVHLGSMRFSWVISCDYGVQNSIFLVVMSSWGLNEKMALAYLWAEILAAVLENGGQCDSIKFSKFVADYIFVTKHSYTGKVFCGSRNLFLQ